MNDLFQKKYQDDILGTNSTFDRVIITGSIIPIAYQQGLSTFLSANNILLKEFIDEHLGLCYFRIQTFFP